MPPRLHQLGLLCLLLCSTSCSLQAQEPKAPSPEQRARAVAQNERGIKLFERGHHERALSELREALSLDPSNATIKENVAKCYAHVARLSFEARRFEDAARDFGLAAAQAPELADYALWHGRALIEGRAFRDAVETLGAAASRFPKNALAHSLLGYAHYQQGHLEEAISSWTRALELDPRDKLARTHLERAKREQTVEGDMEESFGARHFQLRFDGTRDAALGQRLAPLLEAAYEDVGRAFGQYPRGQIPVVVYPGQAFRALTGAHAWVRALYDGKIRLPGGGLGAVDDATLARVLRHEVTHAFVARMGGKRVPVWLHEGLAKIIDSSPIAASRTIIARNGAAKLSAFKKSFSSVKDPRKVQRLYASSQLFVQWLAARGGGLYAFDRVLAGIGSGRPIGGCLEESFGGSLEELYSEWSRR